jgi:ComF family protein
MSRWYRSSWPPAGILHPGSWPAGLQGLARAVLPPTCLLCGAPGHEDLDLCSGCLADLPRNPGACPNCALPLPPAAPPGWPCGACLRQPPPFDAAYVPLEYAAAVPYLVTGLKFRRHMANARLLGELLARALADRPGPLPQAILPVPLHPARLRSRGFNQSLELARIPARRLGLPLATRCCVRRLATAPQTSLGAQVRAANVRGAFAVLGPLPYSHLAILDDVMTTGSTVAELARVLKSAGVRRVEIWAAARSVA